MSGSSHSSAADGNPSTSSYQQQAQSSGSLYSFSVHQPYTNWPLHASHTTPYAPSWYSHATHHYKSYRQQGAQTVEIPAKPTGEDKGQDLKFAKQWDSVFLSFFKRVGMQQTLAGFREDMLLLNEEWEQEEVPKALQALVKELQELTQDSNSALEVRNLEERKLDHIQFQRDVEPQTPPSTVKSVSRLLKQSRKRNGASNRAEFLLTAAEKRRRLNELGEKPSRQEASTEGHTEDREAATGNMDVDTPVPSCARADAKFQDRDTQMKYDIAKNEDGPLRRTMKRAETSGESSLQSTQTTLPVQYGGSREPDAKGHPAIAARMETIEDHLAVRYVPSLPRSLLDRLKFLEDYIIRLEKDYPPWAALHFNQPNRGWPPPPRSIPIIVPPHLASSESSNTRSEVTISVQERNNAPLSSTATAQPSSSKSAGALKAKSSLHRAVMGRLEIQRAIGDLAGGGLTSTASGS